MKTRGIQQIVEGIQTTDGAGVNLTRIIGSPELNMLDPFLLLDEFRNNEKNLLSLLKTISFSIPS